MNPFTPLFTRVCTSANFYMQLSKGWVSRTAKVGTRGFPADKFDLEYPFVKWNHKDPGLTVRELSSNKFTNMIKLIDKGLTMSKDGAFTDYVETSQYHLYVFGGVVIKVPKAFQPVFSDSKSWLAFRGMLKMFPPYGGEVPGVGWFNTGADESYLGEPTYSLDRELSLEIANYQHKLLTQDLAPSGSIALGHNFVECSEATIIETERHIFRISLMDAINLHILRGPAWWVQIYDKVDNTLTFQAYGGGKNNLPGVDELNNHLAGLVFGTMLETYGFVLNEAAKSTEGVKPITEGRSDLLRPLLQSMQRVNPELAYRRRIVSGLDSFSRLAVLMRSGLEAITGEEGIEIGLCADKTTSKK